MIPIDGDADVAPPCHHFVGVRDGGVGDMLVFELYGIADAFVLGGLDVTHVRAVVLR